jgi:hypothetical protein
MVRVYNWKIERSGEGLRVIGVDAEGKTVKLTKVRHVSRTDGVIVALRDTSPIETAILV